MITVPLGVGVVGCGAIGARRARVARAHPGSRLVAVADRDVDRAAKVAKEVGAAVARDYEEIVRDPEVDVVIVATTHDWLAPVSVSALRSGKHVLCEKPLSRNAAEAETVLEAARTSPGRLSVGFNHRYHPAVRRAHELAASGEIGPVLFIRCRYGHGGRPGYEGEWRMNAEVSGGGELLDQGIHAIDLFRWFLGELAEVTGITASFVWKAPVEDNVFALFRSAKGAVASLHASWTQWKNLFSFEVFGERGALLVEGLGRSYGMERLTVYRRRAEGGAPEEEQVEFPGPDRSWALEWEAFVGALRAGSAPAVGPADGMAALRLVQAVYESARSGAMVRPA